MNIVFKKLEKNKQAE